MKNKIPFHIIIWIAIFGISATTATITSLFFIKDHVLVLALTSIIVMIISSLTLIMYALEKIKEIMEKIEKEIIDEK